MSDTKTVNCHICGDSVPEGMRGHLGCGYKLHAKIKAQQATINSAREIMESSLELYPCCSSGGSVCSCTACRNNKWLLANPPKDPK